MVVVVEDMVVVVEDMVVVVGDMVVVVFEDIGVLVLMLVVCTAVPSMVVVALNMEAVGHWDRLPFGRLMPVDSNSVVMP